jgi:phosphohistidine swiveling domain-containing protein
MLSYNSPLGMCPDCSGLGTRLEADAARVVPDPTLTIDEGAVEPWRTVADSSGWTARIVHALDAATLDSFTRDDILVLLEENAFAYADWHSLLVFVKGVAATGRPAHHLMQVAREIGVPVIGHVGGLERILDGQLLRLDAGRGTVELMG